MFSWHYGTEVNTDTSPCAGFRLCPCGTAPHGSGLTEALRQEGGFRACLLRDEKGAGPAAARLCPARLSCRGEGQPRPLSVPTVSPSGRGCAAVASSSIPPSLLPSLPQALRIIAGSSGPHCGQIWVRAACNSRAMITHTNMLIGLALHFLGKKIISLDKRFLPLWRFSSSVPQHCGSWGWGKSTFFSPSLCMLSSGGRRFSFLFFHSFATGCYDIILPPQKGKLRKQASSLTVINARITIPHVDYLHSYCACGHRLCAWQGHLRKLWVVRRVFVALPIRGDICYLELSCILLYISPCHTELLSFDKSVPGDPCTTKV